ncbi:MAG: protein kinase, partial [Polyangiaceae bacterium]|nr:protein kinase [Polyangiaceae bacterium]
MMLAAQSIAEGTLVHERFRIAALVGEGGMGAVYRAVDEATGETVAVKVLKNTLGAQAAERFLREAQVLAGLDHPGIVRFKHVGTLDTGGAFLVMEWLEGEDLAQRLAGRGVTFLEAVRAVRGVAEALVIAHGQGLVHRDVKPQNIFLVGGRAEQVKILDFGIARGGKLAKALTDPGTAMGTPAYMAPEQATGGAQVDARADLFSLGCVLYECIAGAPPFFGDSPIACLAQVLLTEPAVLGTVVPGVPKPLEMLVMRLLSKDPAARPDAAAVVARDLGAVEPLLTTEGSAGAVSGRHVSRFEKRVASIVVSRDLEKMDSREEGATLPFAEVHSALTPAQEAVGRRGGSVNVLWDGTLLGVFTGSSSAGDLAKAAASAALELKARTPERALAVATDLANVLGTSATGAAVGRAFGLAGRSGIIRVDATTRALVGDTFLLRGTEGGTELVAARDASESTSRQPVLGRAREIGILNAALDSVREDELARSVIVVGPAGQGKTSVVRAFLDHALKAAEPPRVVRVACDPGHAETSFFVATEVVRRALSISPTAAPSVQRLALRRGLSEGGAGATFHFLEHAMGLDIEGSAPVVAEASYDPRLLAERTLDEWLEVIRLFSKKRVLLLVIEDLHACDGPSARFLDRALAELVEQSVLVVATARPEIDEAHPRIFADRLLDRIQLAPLPRRAADALVRAHLGASAAADAVERIVEHGAGNPLFLLELSTAAGEGLVEPPASIVALLQERLERLESNARRVLRAASVFGESFW